jgi:hypothetical protein
MGSSHRAHCQCGFATNVTVGGGKYTFKEDSQFPYYCGSCGIVSVNIAKLKIDDQPHCPKCGGAEVHQYGKAPVSISFIELPPLSLTSHVANQLAERSAKIGIRLPFGRVREVKPKKTVRMPVTTVADGKSQAFQWGDFNAFALDNLCPLREADPHF